VKENRSWRKGKGGRFDELTTQLHHCMAVDIFFGPSSLFFVVWNLS